MRSVLLAGIALIALPALGAASASVDSYPDVPIPVETLGPASWPGGLGAFEDRPYDVFQGMGVVSDLDPDGPRILVDGLVFRFAIDAQVRLLAGYGAPTLLRPGMALEFYFREGVSDAAGEIIAAVEVPRDSIELD